MKTSLRQFAAFLLVSVVVMQSMGLLFSAMGAPSATFTITSGIYPGAPTYTIWNDTGTIYVKNSLGFIESESSNATTQINYAISQGYANGGAEILIKQGKYQLSGTASTLINLNDKTQIILKGEGPANPANIPLGGGVLPSGSTWGTLLIAPTGFTGAVINMTMTTLVQGENQVKNLALYGNEAYSNIQTGSGGYGIYIGNTKTVNSLIEDVSVIGFKEGMVIGGSTIQVMRGQAYYNDIGFRIPSSGEYNNIIDSLSYIYHSYGFYISSSGPNTLTNTNTMTNVTADYHTTGSAGTLMYLPVGYYISSQYWIKLIGTESHADATGFYFHPGSINGSITMIGGGADSEHSTPYPSTSVVAVQIFGETHSRIMISGVTLRRFQNGVWIVVSGTDSWTNILNTSLSLNNVAFNSTLLAGTKQGNWTLVHNMDFADVSA